MEIQLLGTEYTYCSEHEKRPLDDIDPLTGRMSCRKC